MKVQRAPSLQLFLALEWEKREEIEGGGSVQIMSGGFWCVGGREMYGFHHCVLLFPSAHTESFWCAAVLAGTGCPWQGGEGEEGRASFWLGPKGVGTMNQALNVFLPLLLSFHCHSPLIALLSYPSAVLLCVFVVFVCVSTRVLYNMATHESLIQVIGRWTWILLSFWKQFAVSVK